MSLGKSDLFFPFESEDMVDPSTAVLYMTFTDLLSLNFNSTSEGLSLERKASTIPAEERTGRESASVHGGGMLFHKIRG